MDREPAGDRRKPLIDRLLDKIDGPWNGTTTESDCWPFVAAWRSAWGYGMIRAGGHAGRALLAHREMLRASVTSFDDSLVVRHRCDNPVCCNPSHLEQGSQRDNVRDQIRRMRRRLSRRSRPRDYRFAEPTPEDYEA